MECNASAINDKHTIIIPVHPLTPGVIELSPNENNIAEATNENALIYSPNENLCLKIIKLPMQQP